tara:strand:+ start:1192 stop:1398 length:207 start_codon:yes stop_codon:yes gene_type:complete
VSSLLSDRCKVEDAAIEGVESGVISAELWTGSQLNRYITPDYRGGKRTWMKVKGAETLGCEGPFSSFG